MKFALIISLALLSACASPYTRQIKALSRQMHSGQITVAEYQRQSRPLIEAQSAWEQRRAANAIIIAGGIQQGAANYQAQTTNVYRPAPTYYYPPTPVYTPPQRVDVYHHSARSPGLMVHHWSGGR